jgi:hypothetical protein
MKHLFDDQNFTEKQASIALGLLEIDHMKSEGFKRLEFFEYGGRVFHGNYESAILAFVKNNPTGGDFYVWLQQVWGERIIKRVTE